MLFQSYGIAVERLPTEHLMEGVNRHCEDDGMLFLPSYDDLNLIAGHGTLVTCFIFMQYMIKAISPYIPIHAML